MKLATLKSDRRDGTLVVVSDDLRRRTDAPYPTLQAALDDWREAEPALRRVAAALEADRASGLPFDQATAHSPLPRAFAWCDGSAYLSHMARVRRARGVEMPASFQTDPLMYQGGSDSFLGPRDDILIEDEAWGIDFEAEVAVVTTDVPMGVSPTEAVGYIALVMLCNDVSLRNLIPAELAKSFGFFQSKPSSAFSPVAVTPDGLGQSWQGSRLSGRIHISCNDAAFGAPDTGQDLAFDFAQLIAHAAKTRRLGAGTIIGSGTISNQDEEVGGACLQETRVKEVIKSGEATTPFMSFGDEVRIDMLGADGGGIFGTIHQKVSRYTRA